MNVENNKLLNITLSDYNGTKLGDKDFAELAKFIYHNFGIKMPEVKKVMLQGRLYKRLKALNFKSYSQYKEYLFSKEGQHNEIYNFLNVVTTNKTDFFREAQHFNFLDEQVLPYFVKNNVVQPIKIWSAGCSSGEELYTLAIVLKEHIRLKNNLNYKILGTDISEKVLDIASKGVYAMDKVKFIPLDIKKRYFLKSKDNTNVRVNPILQNNINVKYLNLIDNNYNVNEKFDVIFCRNVMIYFDRKTQEQVVTKLLDQLNVGGYLFIGHSESLMGLNLPVEHVKPTIFRKI